MDIDLSKAASLVNTETTFKTFDFTCSRQAFRCAYFGIGIVLTLLTASSKFEIKLKVVVVEEFKMGVASVSVDIFNCQEALLLAVLSSSKRQKNCYVSIHGGQGTCFEKVAKVRGGYQIGGIRTKCVVNLCTINTCATITTRVTPTKEIKELSRCATTRIGIDLRKPSTALLSLLSALVSAPVSSFPVIIVIVMEGPAGGLFFLKKIAKIWVNMDPDSSNSDYCFTMLTLFWTVFSIWPLVGRRVFFPLTARASVSTRATTNFMEMVMVIFFVLLKRIDWNGFDCCEQRLKLARKSFHPAETIKHTCKWPTARKKWQGCALSIFQRISGSDLREMSNWACSTISINKSKSRCDGMKRWEVRQFVACRLSQRRSCGKSLIVQFLCMSYATFGCQAEKKSNGRLI